MQYRFTLKDNTKKAFRLFVWFLFFLHIVAAGMIGLNSVGGDVKLNAYILMGMYIFCSVVYFIYRKKGQALDIYSFIMAFIYAYFWVKHVGVFALLIFISVYLFGLIVNKSKTSVLFSTTGVHLKRIFKTIIYPWQKLDNVILKDNLLTIDFKSNKLIQAELDEPHEQTDAIMFNRFCKEQLQNNN